MLGIVNRYLERYPGDNPTNDYYIMQGWACVAGWDSRRAEILAYRPPPHLPRPVARLRAPCDGPIDFGQRGLDPTHLPTPPPLCLSPPILDAPCPPMCSPFAHSPVSTPPALGAPPASSPRTASTPRPTAPYTACTSPPSTSPPATLLSVARHFLSRVGGLLHSPRFTHKRWWAWGGPNPPP